jgi:hypothetical protein
MPRGHDAGDAYEKQFGLQPKSLSAQPLAEGDHFYGAALWEAGTLHATSATAPIAMVHGRVAVSKQQARSACLNCAVLHTASQRRQDKQARKPELEASAITGMQREYRQTMCSTAPLFPART